MKIKVGDKIKIGFDTYTQGEWISEPTFFNRKVGYYPGKYETIIKTVTVTKITTKEGAPVWTVIYVKDEKDNESNFCCDSLRKAMEIADSEIFLETINETDI